MRRRRNREGIKHGGWILLGLLAFATGCGPEARVEGEVKDYLGRPLQGVTVGISKTQLTTVTGQNGRYELQYLPGRFRVEFTKPEYHDAHLDFEVVAETKIPAVPVSLLKLPPSRGMYFFGESEYQPLSRGALSSEILDSNSWGLPQIYAYKVQGNFGRVEGGGSFKFLDNDGQSTSLFSVDEKGFVLTCWDRNGATRDEGNIQKESVEEIVPGYLLREAELRPGRYAFVMVRWDEISLNQTRRRYGARLQPVTDPVYLFEVVEPQDKPAE